ncbi:MAG: hypothetical protein EOO45_12475 [Flavobacterium sp.]|nr:MAG: hypothetical protein EOO45_12475 [Flavobacterium sp.]
MSLGFGVVAEEAISQAQIISDDDPELQKCKSIWHSFYKEIENITGYEILTASTGSCIKIFAFSFEVEDV